GRIVAHRQLRRREDVHSDTEVEAAEQSQQRVTRVERVAWLLTRRHLEAVRGELLAERGQSRNGCMTEVARYAVLARERRNARGRRRSGGHGRAGEQHCQNESGACHFHFLAEVA